MHAKDIFLKNLTEENQKRGTTGYGQIGFNYDDSSPTQNGANEKAENDVKDETPDEAYVPHHRFYIPPNMELVCSLHIWCSLNCKFKQI